MIVGGSTLEETILFVSKPRKRNKFAVTVAEKEIANGRKMEEELENETETDEEKESETDEEKGTDTDDESDNETDEESENERKTTGKEPVVAIESSEEIVDCVSDSSSIESIGVETTSTASASEKNSDSESIANSV